MKRFLYIIFGLTLVSAFALAGCDSTDTSVVGGRCSTDADCNDGYFCSDAGVCLPKTDGDVTESEFEYDIDVDWEQWEKECPEEPTMPAQPADPCKKWVCVPVDPPECWNCFQAADPAQNGDICDSDGSPGICADGECKGFADGDEDEDQDQVSGCAASGGTCAASADDCDRGSRPASDAMGCESVCCLPLTGIDCYQQDGYCTQSSPGGVPACRDGYAPATNTDNECVWFDEICCLPVPQDCVGEGEVGSSFDEKECCEGLTQVGNAWPDENNGCMAPNDGSFRCTFCDNGECGSGENWCNCPDDCAAPGECTMNSDCPAPSCTDGMTGAITCIQTTTTCDVDTGNCVATEQTLYDKACNESSGMCENITPPCTGEGEMGFMPDGECCEGLTQAEYAIIDDSGQCSYIDCSCFVCLKIGDNFCDDEHYENFCNSTDCEDPPACTTDDDCAPNSCEGLSGLPNCIQYTERCVEGECRASQTQLENSMCNEETGMCEPRNPTSCEMQEGYCTVWEDECETGYKTASDPKGCPGGWSAKCCIPDEPNPCTDGGGTCVPNYPGSACPGGYHAEGEISCNAEGVFCCMPDIECETSEGYCSSLQLGCDADYYNADTSMGCGDAGDAICCLPRNPTRCAQQEGLCVAWQSQCPPDTYSSPDNLDCTRSEQCCLPVGPCIEEGERGSSFEGDECCEGLTDISNSMMDETGQCIGIPDGSFYCTQCGNGECGPGENECNCAVDCGGSVECYSASDCVDLPWNVDCYGHWECNNNQCSEACGPPCGNRRCEPEQGESEETCPQDCQGTGECSSDWDCGRPQCYDVDSGCMQETPICENGACSSVSTTSEGWCDPRSGECMGGEESCFDLEGYCAGFNDGCEEGYVQDEASCGDQVCAGGCICCVPDVPTTCESDVCVYFWESCPSGMNNTGDRLDCPIMSTCCE